jgi:hypothetical protein
MKVIALLAAAAAFLAFGAATASAHSGSPWITANRAAQTIYNNDIAWDEGIDTVTYVSCRGSGARLGTRFRHFRCYVESLEDDPYWVRAHSVRGGVEVDFLAYD